MDVRSNWYPRRFVDPNEPGLVAGYTFADNELAQFGYYLNRASTGAAYDLTTRTGTPIVGQGGGIYSFDSATNYYGGNAHAGIVAMGGIAELDRLPTGSRFFYAPSTAHLAYWSVAGWLQITLNAGGTYSSAANNYTGRGPVHWIARHTGTNQELWVNGVLSDSDAVVLSAPAGTCRTGNHGTSYLQKTWGSAPSDPRASYIRDFASRVLWQWTPRDVGEGPAGGILTGSYSGVGGWTCPLGAATMSFVQRGDRLTLADTQAVNLNRIDFEFANRPWFGSFLVEYEVRNPATDSMVVGFTPMRGVDPTAAASGSYWLHVRQVAGPWWRSSVYLANGAQIDAADTPTLPVAGDRGKVLFTRDVDGTIQVWSYLQSTNGWWWSTATGTDVTVLPEACITVAPRGAYVERVTWFQGAASPHELGIQVP